MKNLCKFLVLCFVFFSSAIVSLAGDFSANTKNEILTAALNRLESANKTQVLNVIRGNNPTNHPIRLMFRDMAVMGYGTCEAVTAKTANGDLVILISSRHKTAPIEAIACLIAHESVHSANTGTYDEEVKAWTTEVQTWTSFTEYNPSLKDIKCDLTKRLNYLSKLYTKDGYQMTSIENIIAANPAYSSLKRS